MVSGLPPSIGKPLTPKRQTTWMRVDYRPVAACLGFAHDDGEVECNWRLDPWPGSTMREMKADATRHVEATGHVVHIDQVTRTQVGSKDPRDDEVEES